jgi:hypothetical protein
MDAGTTVLAKPFQISELAAALSAALASGPAPGAALGGTTP